MKAFYFYDRNLRVISTILH